MNPILEIMQFAIPIAYSLALIAAMYFDKKARSLAVWLFGATVMLGYNGQNLVRIIWVPWEFLMVAIFLFNLRYQRVWNNLGVLACIGFLLVALFSLVVAAVFAGAVTQSIIGGAVNVAAVTLAAGFLLSDIRLNEKHETALKYFGLAAVFLAVSGIVEFFVQPTSRVSGIYSNANVFAYMVALGTMTVIHYWRGALRIGFSGILLFGLLLSGSRAGYLMFGAFMMWKLYELSRRKQFVPAAGILAAGVVAAVLAFQVVEQRYHKDRNVDFERTLIYRSAGKALSERPLTGIGWNQFQHQFRNLGAYRLSTDTFEVDMRRGIFGSREVLVTHNDYLSVLIEMGIPAFAGFMWIFLYSAKCAIFGKQVKRSIIVPLYIGNAIYSMTHNSSSSLLFFYFMFLPLAFHRLEFTSARVRGRSFKARSAVPVGHSPERLLPDPS